MHITISMYFCHHHHLSCPLIQVCIDQTETIEARDLATRSASNHTMSAAISVTLYETTFSTNTHLFLFNSYKLITCVVDISIEYFQFILTSFILFSYHNLGDIDPLPLIAFSLICKFNSALSGVMIGLSLYID